METELKCFCVHCGQPVAFPQELAGTKLVCPGCQKSFPLPGGPIPAIKSRSVFHYVFYQENVQMHMKIKNKNQWIASSREDLNENRLIS